MKLYLKGKPAGWTSSNPSGVFEETATKLGKHGARKEYTVYYRVTADPVISINAKHRQPSSPLTLGTGLRIRKENWEAPGPRENGHGTAITLKLDYFTCLDCGESKRMCFESQTLAVGPDEYGSRTDGYKVGFYVPHNPNHGHRRSAGRDGKTSITKTEFYRIDRERSIPYRDKSSFANVCTKCATRRFNGKVKLSTRVPCEVRNCSVLAKVAESGPSVCPIHLDARKETAKPGKLSIRISAPRLQPLVEQYGMIVNGPHGGSKLKIGGQNVIRLEDIAAYNSAILLKRKSKASLKPRIHKAA